VRLTAVLMITPLRNASRASNSNHTSFFQFFSIILIAVCRIDLIAARAIARYGGNPRSPFNGRRPLSTANISFAICSIVAVLIYLSSLQEEGSLRSRIVFKL
jgi:hypothetical protein